MVGRGEAGVERLQYVVVQTLKDSNLSPGSGEMERVETLLYARVSFENIFTLLQPSSERREIEERIYRHHHISWCTNDSRKKPDVRRSFFLVRHSS